MFSGTSFPPFPYNFYCYILQIYIFNMLVIPIKNILTSVDLKKSFLASQNIVDESFQHTLLSDLQ